MKDVVIVGAGITGAVCARLLKDAGCDVAVVERRQFIGGNCADYELPFDNGYMINMFGPHYFRTNSERIWSFVNHYAMWYDYAATIKSFVDGNYEDWPVTVDWCWEHCASLADRQGSDPANFEEACLQRMPKIAYEKFIKPYTEKQWGMSCNKLAAGLASRIELRGGADRRLKQCKYQALPFGGYSKFIGHMLSDVDIYLGCDWLSKTKEFQAKKVIFTGSIDSFFFFSLGHLRYRTQHRETRIVASDSFYYPTVQINFPSRDYSFIREIEWKHLDPLGGTMHGNRYTAITREYPRDAARETEFEYPYQDEENENLYKRYRDLADELPSIVFAGRLGRYRYMDMDQAIAAAMTLCAKEFSVGEMIEEHL